MEQPGQQLGLVDVTSHEALVNQKSNPKLKILSVNPGLSIMLISLPSVN